MKKTIKKDEKLANLIVKYVDNIAIELFEQLDCSCIEKLKTELLPQIHQINDEVTRRNMRNIASTFPFLITAKVQYLTLHLLKSDMIENAEFLSIFSKSNVCINIENTLNDIIELIDLTSSEDYNKKDIKETNATIH